MKIKAVLIKAGEKMGDSNLAYTENACRDMVREDKTGRLSWNTEKKCVMCEVEYLPEPELQKSHNVGGHYYPGCATDVFHTSDCEYGCGCWMGQSRSGGPDGVDPFGPCPGNSAHEPASPVGEMACVTCQRPLKLCRCARYVCGACLKLLGGDNGHDKTFPAGDHLDSLVKCFRCGGSSRPLYWMTAYHYELIKEANASGSLKPGEATEINPADTHHGPDFKPPKEPDVKELRSRIEKASGTLLEMLGRMVVGMVQGQGHGGKRHPARLGILGGRPWLLAGGLALVGGQRTSSFTRRATRQQRAKVPAPL